MTVPDVLSPEDLYGVAPDEFVAARNTLAKQLRADKRRDEAEVVARLRRPPQSAWALNLLARTNPTSIDDFLTAAERLSDALAEDSPELRDAQSDFGSAIEVEVSSAAQAAGIG